MTNSTALGALAGLHALIDARVVSIRDQHTDWPCGKGCDNCCRHLAEVPRLSGAEWALLEEGLAALSAVQLRAVGTKISALSTGTRGPHTCPMLDQNSGACLIYAHRPIACRSYGFYVQRDLGLYCGEIKAQVADGGLADVVWGNHDAVDRDLARLGEVRPLTSWFEDSVRLQAD